MTPHAEWTKLRTVRAWVAGLLASALMVVAVAVLTGISTDQRNAPPVPVGPEGGPVTDSFYLVHRSLPGNGTISASVIAPDGAPWAKAGLIVKDGTRPGSRYAAIMLTGDHGVRLQHDFVHDVPAAPARWLRLDRDGDTVTGATSADGTHWTTVGTAQVPGRDARVGLFVASPQVVRGRGTVPSASTAVFDDVRVPPGHWTGEQIGAGTATFGGYPRGTIGSFTETAGRLTVTGAGDLAPAVRDGLGSGGTLREILTGTFAALVAVIVLASQFVSTEYRDDLMRVTLTATPRRGRVLAAKAVVLGAVTFVAGLAGSAVAVPLGSTLARASGVYVFPVSPWTQLRVELGTAALLATTAILAVAVATVFRRGAVTTVLTLVVLPYLLVAQLPFLPPDAAHWLTTVTPAAAFAVQQTLVPYHQVSGVYTPYNDYYPLPPWAGLAVLAAYTAVALAVAAAVLRRRDA
ncbi:hypothetical protein BLA60_30030 [Actinophytocola xinjiangensis]|uniref:ABC-type transport system involved in multi-copper enzyme maturation permease subunit n=1 Tax=Actinophytocola xinjiangensis TaxID=485602 RepID=A0A7Z0WHH3_9PSEU|nr:ABC transporter permease subunit [Actinophytocola xinjiangensis]OLF06792.1 hypothetical protein BLA60_30030 [Actinophytocola xinjiangensis]